MTNIAQGGGGFARIFPGIFGGRAFWLKHLHQWHWISAAICLVGMLLFAATGITLNHAASIEARPRVEKQERLLPPRLLELARKTAADDRMAPAPIADWVADNIAVTIKDRAVEWSDDEIYVALPRPGGDAWLTISLDSGEVVYERTDRGWISYFNDLHKGRNTGTAWSWFLDIFAGACLVFCVTGLFLLQLHARNRPATWPVVGLGLLIPLVLALLFIH